MAKNIKYSPNSGIRTYRGDGTEMLQCVLLADEAPASLEISGADVEGLNDNTVIAAGSTLITPSANYVAFEDGVFSKKSGGGSGSGGGSALPAVTNADNGKVLSVVDGTWAAADNRFVVALTPTAADYSGTMDKTTAEIDDAWNSGKSIWFRVTGLDGLFPLALRDESDVGNRYSVYAINLDANALLLASTSPNSNQYGTTIYQLTPLGS